ncbi:cell surface antigen-like domain protein [Rickettsia amblyommatis str. Darkwater]|uniref:Cell surface antigen-like domain protein n=1 Tax=Rickettsia amblyommatis str. Ac/Pa TaxID=1359164 RepID=A0A0F3N0L3_RICAM|nr:cell surface antigen-like domain protein [Rickettsia amblyommatis str. Ac/Pa]KJV88707.1 cell surface antigen-like domain protein [Rickettsia amblyommatis str. Darkwater]
MNPASVLKLMTTVASGKNSTIELTGNNRASCSKYRCS